MTETASLLCALYASQIEDSMILSPTDSAQPPSPSPLLSPSSTSQHPANHSQSSPLKTETSSPNLVMVRPASICVTCISSAAASLSQSLDSAPSPVSDNCQSASSSTPSPPSVKPFSQPSSRRCVRAQSNRLDAVPDPQHNPAISSLRNTLQASKCVTRPGVLNLTINIRLHLDRVTIWKDELDHRSEHSLTSRLMRGWSRLTSTSIDPTMSMFGRQ